MKTQIEIEPNPIVFMFSGQGSQYYHMGRELYISQPVFKKCMDTLNDYIREHIGESILEQIYDKKRSKGDSYEQILHSSLAIFMVEYSITQVLFDNNIYPDYVIGASLGELAAAVVSGIMTYKDAIKVIFKNAEIIGKYSLKGRMISIFDDPALYNNIPEISNHSDLAASNYYKHFIISGETEKLEYITTILEKMDILYQKLSVAGAFHSSIMDVAESEYKIFLDTLSFKSPKIEYISCMYGHSLSSFPKYHLWEMIRKPILFQKTIKEIEKDKKAKNYIDVGPSGTLSTFVKYNLHEDSKSTSYTILNPYGQELNKLNIVKKVLGKNQIKRIKMITYVFPGQGSQAKGMGKDLFEKYQELIPEIENILGYSIKDLCLEDPNNLLNKTQYTQPAIYVINALTYMDKVNEYGCRPDYVAGHSLGEYNALFVAGAFDFLTGLKLVKKRSELMGQAEGGSMAAIVGMSEKQISDVLRRHELATIDIANYNSPAQIVIAGPEEDIKNAASLFEAEKGLYFPLKVSGAFHTKYMKKAAEEFSEYLNMFSFKNINIPVISNVEARPYNNNIKDNLAKQMYEPVRWTESIQFLLGKGDMEFYELGHGSVLTGLIKKIKKGSDHLIKAAVIEKQIKANKNQDIMDTKTKVINENTENTNKKHITGINHIDNSIPNITPENLGCEEYKKDYNLRYAYATGGMYRGIASIDLVVRMGKAGMMSYFGTGGLDLNSIDEAIRNIQESLTEQQPYGMNLVNNPLEKDIVELFLKHNIQNIEAAAYTQLTPALVKYRLKGLSNGNGNGQVKIANRIQAKISRPEIAEQFLSPAPEKMVNSLLQHYEISEEEAKLSRQVPMADDLCVEADSGGHTDHGVAYALMPAITRLRDNMMRTYRYDKKVRIGAAGGIGTPEAAAAAFVMGADFILTGSINQCTVESGASEKVKDMLQEMNIQDTEYVPAADMFEIGAKVQVLKRGLLFPARANKLYALYQHHGSLDEIDINTRKRLEEKYFKRTFESIYEEVKIFFEKQDPDQIKYAEKNPKHKMALIFRWYLNNSSRLALRGSEKQIVDYQIQCGPALGAFNQWVKGTELEGWRNRHVDQIGEKIMLEASVLLNQRYRAFCKK